MGNKAWGFITEEIRKKGERIGFRIRTLPEGKTGLLARIHYPSPFRVGKYGVDIQALEELGCRAILRAKKSDKLIIVDEIGKMELFSEKFRTALTEVLDSPNKVIATIMQSSSTFADQAKKRPDAKVLILKRENFDETFQEILRWLDKSPELCL